MYSTRFLSIITNKSFQTFTFKWLITKSIYTVPIRNAFWTIGPLPASIAPTLVRMHTNSLGIILAKVNRHTYYYFLGVFNSYMLRMAACTAYWLFTASALVSIITLALKWRVNTSAMHTVRILHALVTFWTKPAWMTHTFTRNSTTSMNAIISANGCKKGNRILSIFQIEVFL